MGVRSFSEPYVIMYLSFIMLYTYIYISLYVYIFISYYIYIL